MPLHVSYDQKTYRPPVPEGNETDQNPVEFEIVPAFGADLARLRSISVAAAGVTDAKDEQWTPEVQRQVIEAFATGAEAFANTVTLVRGITIDAGAALRAGIIADLPTRDGKPDPKAAVPITTGKQFAKVCSMMRFLILTQLLALEIIVLTAESHKVRDGRFFVQPSGSGGAETTGASTTTARSARRKSRGRAIAGDQDQTASGPAGTSPSS